MQKSKEIIILAIVVGLIFFLMEEKYADSVNGISKYVVEILKKNFFIGYLLVLLGTMPFNYFLIPGMNIVIIMTAYFVGTFWESFFVMLSAILFWVLMSWLTFEKLFVFRFKKGLKNDKIYKVLKIW